MNKPWPCLKCLVIMEPIDDDHCKCPICKTEVWYSYQEEMSDDDVREIMQPVSAKGYNPDFSILGGPPILGGGSKSKGKSNKKQLMSKPSTTELFNKLANTKNKISKSPGRPRKNVDNNNCPKL